MASSVQVASWHPRSAARWRIAPLAWAAVVWGAACTAGDTSPAGSGRPGEPGSGANAGFILPEETGGGPCVNLTCQQASCSGQSRTTLAGTVYTPSGELPLYNVMVYVPNSALEPFAEGASCNTCDGGVSGNPVVSALTNTRGEFLLEDVPVGENIPLVMQVGKWRRQVTLPRIEPCTANTIADRNLTRLPANRSEGDIPRIALSTGALDALECLLRKVGISDSEFTPPEESGRVNLFAGHEGTRDYDRSTGGARFPDSENALWNRAAALQPYDVVLLSCEGDEYPNEKPTAARRAMFDYINGGGRVFLSHWHKIWLDQGPAPFPDLMEFNDRDDDLTLTASVDTSFPKGEALADWLVNVGGSEARGQVQLVDAQNTAAAENPAFAQRWIYDPMDPATRRVSVKYVSANAPLESPPAQQCGRIVYSDIHVSSGDESAPGRPFPTGCTSNGLSPQEKVLIFMLFDLSACIVPDDTPPVPPSIIR
jgi:hypothetical protein